MEKSIEYCRDTKDYRMALDGRTVGFRATYGQADHALDEIIFDALIYTVTYEPEPPPPPPEPENNPDKDNKPDEIGPHQLRYTRDARFDRAGEWPSAWVDQIGLMRWCPAGVDPNTRA